MSCGRTENDDEENPSLPPAIATVTKCGRCSKPPLIMVRENGYCQDCFLDAFKTKTKRGIESAKRRSHTRLSTNDQKSSVMIAFSGGPGSRVLLEIMKPFLTNQVPVSSKYTPVLPFSKIQVVYVDESGVPGYGGIDRTEEVKEIAESAGFEFVGIKLEDIFATGSLFTMNSTSTDLNSTSISTFTSTSTSSLPLSTPLESLLTLLSPHSTTSRTSLHSSLLISLLRQTAKNNSCDILLTGETATRIAIKVLSGMAEGRGFSMGEEVGVEWEQEGVEQEGEEGGGVCQIRPLTILLGKEISFFSRIKELKSLVMINPGTGVEPRVAGIEALTEAFVNGLESAFPSTVSTINKTAGKLGMRTSNDKELNLKGTPCPLCGFPAQNGANEWRTSITISTFATAPSSSSKSLESSSSSSSKLNSTKEAAEEIPLASLLCYGCLLIYQGIQQQQSITKFKKSITSSSSSSRGESIEVKKDEGEEVIEFLPSYVGDLARLRWDRERSFRDLIEGDEDDIGEARRIKTEEEVRGEIENFLI